MDTIAAEQVRDWFASMSTTPGSANRPMPLLSTMIRMVELSGARVHNTNPCKNTRRFKMASKERFLSSEGIARLNAALTSDEFYCSQAVAIIRLLLLTGCRIGKIVGLR